MSSFLSNACNRSFSSDVVLFNQHHRFYPTSSIYFNRRCRFQPTSSFQLGIPSFSTDVVFFMRVHHSQTRCKRLNQWHRCQPLSRCTSDQSTTTSFSGTHTNSGPSCPPQRKKKTTLGMPNPSATSVHQLASDQPPEKQTPQEKLPMPPGLKQLRSLLGAGSILPHKFPARYGRARSVTRAFLLKRRHTVRLQSVAEVIRTSTAAPLWLVGTASPVLPCLGRRHRANFRRCSFPLRRQRRDRLCHTREEEKW